MGRLDVTHAPIYSDVIGVVKEAHELGEITSKSTQKTACPSSLQRMTKLSAVVFLKDP